MKYTVTLAPSGQVWFIYKGNKKIAGVPNIHQSSAEDRAMAERIADLLNKSEGLA